MDPTSSTFQRTGWLVGLVRDAGDGIALSKIQTAGARRGNMNVTTERPYASSDQTWLFIFTAAPSAVRTQMQGRRAIQTIQSNTFVSLARFALVQEGLDITSAGGTKATWNPAA